MNFIYVIVMFLLISVGLVGITVFMIPNSSWYWFFMISGVLTSITTLIFIVCSVFYNINAKEEYKNHKNQIVKYKKDLVVEKADVETFKNEFENTFTKLYPDYERDIFKNMQPQDSEALVAILIKYPNLKFDSVLKKYADRLSHKLSTIAGIEKIINDNERRIDDILSDGWVISKIKI